MATVVMAAIEAMAVTDIGAGAFAATILEGDTLATAASSLEATTVSGAAIMAEAAMRAASGSTARGIAVTMHGAIARDCHRRSLFLRDRFGAKP
jgi:hypothetical protein